MVAALIIKLLALLLTPNASPSPSRLVFLYLSFSHHVGIHIFDHHFLFQLSPSSHLRQRA